MPMPNGPLPAGKAGAVRLQPAMLRALHVRPLSTDIVLSPWFATYTVCVAGSNTESCRALPTSTRGRVPSVRPPDREATWPEAAADTAEVRRAAAQVVTARAVRSFARARRG